MMGIWMDMLLPFVHKKTYNLCCMQVKKGRVSPRAVGCGIWTMMDREFIDRYEQKCDLLYYFTEIKTVKRTNKKT